MAQAAQAASRKRARIEGRRGKGPADRKCGDSGPRRGRLSGTLVSEFNHPCLGCAKTRASKNAQSILTQFTRTRKRPDTKCSPPRGEIPTHVSARRLRGQHTKTPSPKRSPRYLLSVGSGACIALCSDSHSMHMLSHMLSRELASRVPCVRLTCHTGPL